MSISLNTKKLTYRPDIDGLRALAVLAVIANHLPGEFLASGFLGVDVFFVISGFVVSASILRQKQTSFSGFYVNFLSRRVKRLMPALTVCVAITGVIVLLADPTPRNSIMTGISALFGVANITLFNFELDYFSPSSKFNAFTHTWSLGVEEQFYVIFPLIIWLTLMGARRERPNIFPVTIVLLSLLSLAAFLWLYGVNQVAAYFLMPMRFWELGAGVLVYLASTKFPSIQTWRILGPATLAAPIALLLCFMTPQEYATWSTPIAVGVTCLLLINSGANLSSRLFSLAPVVYVGKISYSLYLWHWPVISLAPLLLGASWRISTLYIVTMGIAAIVSYHFIERPLRVANWTTKKSLDIAMGFAFSFVLSLAALLALNIKANAPGQEVAVLHPPAFLPILNSGLPYKTCVVDNKRPMTPQTFQQCTIAPETDSGMPTIWALGDSHVGHLQGLLYELHNLEGVGVHLVATPGHHFPDSNGEEYPPRQILYDKMLGELQPGDIVLISRLYMQRKNTSRPQPDISRWIEQVSTLAKELAEREVTLILPGPPPVFNYEDIRECDLAERDACAIERAAIAPAINAVMEQLSLLEMENPNIHVFDLFAAVCPPDDLLCYPDDGTSYLFRDMDHFNSLGSKRIAKPFVTFLRNSGLLLRE